VRNCDQGGLQLESRDIRVITPLDGTHRAVMMAIERGKLHNLIVDQQVFGHQKAMGAVLGAILRLPPIKQALASEQVKSRFVEAMIHRYNDLPKDRQFLV
jgi:hypothetical protein